MKERKCHDIINNGGGGGASGGDFAWKGDAWGEEKTLIKKLAIHSAALQRREFLSEVSGGVYTSLLEQKDKKGGKKNNLMKTGKKKRSGGNISNNLGAKELRSSKHAHRS